MSTNPTNVSTKLQKLEIIKELLKLTPPNDEFKLFMNEYKSKIEIKNELMTENEINDILIELILEKRKIMISTYSGSYPLLIWAINKDKHNNESIILNLLKKYSFVIGPILGSKYKSFLLLFSVYKNCFNLYKYIINNYQQYINDINAPIYGGESILTVSINHKRSEIILYLLSKLNEQINIANSKGYCYRKEGVNKKRSDSLTALTCVLDREYEEEIILKVLRHWSIRTNLIFLNQIEDYGNTALHLAMKLGYLEVIQELVEIEGLNLHIKNKEGYTPSMIAVSNDKGSSIAIIFDSISNEDVNSYKTQIKSMNHSSEFFCDYFNSIQKIKPSSETMEWFMNHPKIDFSKNSILQSYLSNISPSSLHEEFIFKFKWNGSKGTSPIAYYLLNPWCNKDKFLSLVSVDIEKRKIDWSPTSKGGRMRLWFSLYNCISSSSPHINEIMKWIILQLNEVRDNEGDKLGLVFQYFIRSKGIVNLLIHRIGCTKPRSLQEIVSNEISKYDGIDFDTITLTPNLKDMFKEPRSWVVEKGKYSPIFLYEWIRVIDELEIRLEIIINGLGGRQVLNNILMTKKALLPIFSPQNIPPCFNSIQLTFTWVLIVYQYKIISMTELEDILDDDQRLSNYINLCFQFSPYAYDLVDFFCNFDLFKRRLAHEGELTRIFVSIFCNTRLSDRESAFCIKKLLKFNINITQGIIDTIIKKSSSAGGKGRTVPYRSEFFKLLPTSNQ